MYTYAHFAIIVLLLACGCNVGLSNKFRHRVAYVFAGSARSFKNPFVHESIRINLIHAFCPPRTCDSAIFARISLSDNRHQTASGEAIRDSAGITIAADATEKPIVSVALQRLARFPKGSAGSQGSSASEVLPTSSPVIVTWADVGTAEEKAEIQRDFPGPRHKIFSQLDARRYSMYFNRHKSYLQVGEYEAQHGVNFTWVVHARLDSFWGEPMQPVSFWSTLDSTTNHPYGKFAPTPPVGLRKHHAPHQHAQKLPQKSMKIWVSETWWREVPDTFALLPRYFSKQFFDLDSLVAPGVMCLGGPNFDKSSMEPEKLRSRGFSPMEADLVQQFKCSDDEDGHSEQILKRKLQHFRIDLDMGNLGYSNFFFAIVRPNLEDMCFYLEDRRMIGWIFDKQHANRASSFACMRIMSFVRQYSGAIGISANGTITMSSLIDRALPEPFETSMRTVGGDPSAVPIISVTPAEPFITACSLVGGEYRGINCVLDRSVTDWNFMPYRIHKHGSCLSFSYGSKTPTVSLWNATCVNGHSLGHMNTIYSFDQMWHFFPSLKSTQQIQLYVDDGPWRTQDLCLTSVGVEKQQVTGEVPHRRLKIADCTIKRRHFRWKNPMEVGENEMSQQFMVKTRRKSDWMGVYPIDQVEKRSSFITPGHLFAQSHAEGGAAASPHSHANAHAPPTMVISIAQVLQVEDEWALSMWLRDHDRTGAPRNFTQTTLMCVAMYDPPSNLSPEDTVSNDVTLNEHQLAMEPCDSSASRQMFAIERTTVSAWIKHIRVQIERQHYGEAALAAG